MATLPDISAHCPRCGYDVRATISMWEQSCPLTGTCSECGLEFGWARVLRPLKFVPIWSIEYEPRRRRIPRAAVRTCLRSFLPWRFWSRLNMSHEVKPKRILAYIVLLFLPFLLLYVIFQASVGIYVRYQYAQELEAELAQYPVWIAQLQARNPTTNPGIQADLQQLAPEDRQTELQALQASNQFQIAQLQSQINNPPVIDHSYLEAAVEAVALPGSSTSWGRLVDATQSVPYVAPSSLYRTAWQYAAISGWSSAGRDLGDLAIPAYYLLLSVGFGCIGLLLLPVTMVLLPVSRRRAKVKWSHIARVAAYTAFIPATILFVGGILFVSGFVLPVNKGLVVVAMSVLAASGPVAAIIWWWMAIRHYLKMQHGLTIAVLLVMLDFLLIVSGIYLCFRWFADPAAW